MSAQDFHNHSTLHLPLLCPAVFFDWVVAGHTAVVVHIEDAAAHIEGVGADTGVAVDIAVAPAHIAVAVEYIGAVAEGVAEAAPVYFAACNRVDIEVPSL